MRVLIVTNAYPSVQKPYAGIFVKNQYDFMSDHHPEGWNFHVFFLRRSFTGVVGGVLKYAALMLRFVPVLFRRYDVIHLHFFFPLIWFCWIYCVVHPKARLVVTLHGTDVISHFHGRFSRAIHSRLAARIDFVNAVGYAVGQEFQERLGRKIDAVFAAGIDDRVFNPGSPLEKCYDLIFVGSFYEIKGFDLYIEALERLPAGLRLCFIGSGHLESMLERLHARHSVQLRNNLSQSEIADYLKRSRFIVLPSRSESFGLVVSEALYCGIPAIVSRADGLLMQVRHGENGFVTENDPDALAATIGFALSLEEHAYQALVKAAQASNRQYSLSSVCQRLIDIYGGAYA